MKRIVIVGGGVSGLGAACKVRRAAEAGHDVDCVVVEKDARLGGKLFTQRIADPDGRGEYVIDLGSDSFLTEKPAIHRLARTLGIIDDETGTCDESKRTFIVKDGRLVEMPDGIMMFAPTKILPMATTPLYSWPAKFRMALDLVIPPKKLEPGVRNDESLESFVVRRMGRECLDRLAEPLVGGVNGSDPKDMSLAATYPMLLDMEQKHGSLVKGFLAQRKKVEEMRRKYPPKPGQKRRTFFTSFREGLQFLTDRMAEAVGADRIRTGTSVERIERGADGRWRLALAGGETLEADGVVLATEAWAAAPLVSGIDERAGQLVGSIPCSSSATVAFAFDEADCPFDRNWHGILSPMVEHRALTGVSLMSSKWPDRAPDGRVLLRGFLGGPRDQAVLEKSDEELIELARTQLVELLGMPKDAKPLVAELVRWDRGMPQYTLGHLDRMDELDARVASLSGLALAGGGYKGVGVPNCLESGEAAVSKVLGEWGITLAEDTAEEKRVY